MSITFRTFHPKGGGAKANGDGTKTAFALADTSGSILQEITLGATNPNDVGFDAAFAVLKCGIETVYDGYPYDKISPYGVFL